MEWGIVMAFPMVVGMLLLVFAHGSDGDYQTFGHTVVNPPTAKDMTDRMELPKAA